MVDIDEKGSTYQDTDIIKNMNDRVVVNIKTYIGLASNLRSHRFILRNYIKSILICCSDI